jgi:mannose-6-phosphate isomerase-like protein (cupin superfamily)
MTLRDLGLKTDLSDAYLSRIENHKTAITIANLTKLANALGTSVALFFENSSSARHMTVCRAERGKLVQLREGTKLRVQMLAWEKQGKLMEPIEVECPYIPPPLQTYSHAGEEFNFILEGKCEFVYGKEIVELQKGDALYYDASIPHAVRALNKKMTCRILSVVASKDYLFHGDLSRLMKNTG